jgi:hypothetical protein
MLALQRSYGNRAVTSLVQRTCTGGGCCAACDDRSDDAPAEVVDSAPDHVQRQAVDAVSGADPRAPGTDPYVCADPAEQTRKQAFAARTDMKLVNHIPSAGLGKFDIGYTPSSSSLAVTVKLHFSFTDDASAPSGWDLLLAMFRGDDLSKVIWDEAQRKDDTTLGMRLTRFMSVRGRERMLARLLGRIGTDLGIGAGRPRVGARDGVDGLPLQRVRRPLDDLGGCVIRPVAARGAAAAAGARPLDERRHGPVAV